MCARARVAAIPAQVHNIPVHLSVQGPRHHYDGEGVVHYTTYMSSIICHKRTMQRMCIQFGRSVSARSRMTRNSITEMCASDLCAIRYSPVFIPSFMHGARARPMQPIIHHLRASHRSAQRAYGTPSSKIRFAYYFNISDVVRRRRVVPSQRKLCSVRRVDLSASH